VDRFVAAIRRVSQLCGFVAAGLIALGVLVVCHMGVRALRPGPQHHLADRLHHLLPDRGHFHR